MLSLFLSQFFQITLFRWFSDRSLFSPATFKRRNLRTFFGKRVARPSRRRFSSRTGRTHFSTWRGSCALFPASTKYFKRAISGQMDGSRWPNHLAGAVAGSQRARLFHLGLHQRFSRAQAWRYRSWGTRSNSRSFQYHHARNGVPRDAQYYSKGRTLRTRTRKALRTVIALKYSQYFNAKWIRPIGDTTLKKMRHMLSTARWCGNDSVLLFSCYTKEK